MLPFDDNDGAGFWWANSLNTFTRNVAAENDEYGYRFEATHDAAASSSTLADPAARRQHASRSTSARCRSSASRTTRSTRSTGLYGVNLGEGVNRVGPDAKHPFIIRNLKIWDIALRLPPAGAVAAGREHDDPHGASTASITRTTTTTSTATCSISETDTEPFNRGHDDLQRPVRRADGGRPDVRRHAAPAAMPLIQISDDNPTGKAVSHFRNVKVDRLERRQQATAAGQPRRRPAADAEDAEGRAGLPARLVRPRPARQGRQHQRQGLQGRRPASTATRRR